MKNLNIFLLIIKLVVIILIISYFINNIKNSHDEAQKRSEKIIQENGVYGALSAMPHMAMSGVMAYNYEGEKLKDAVVDRYTQADSKYQFSVTVYACGILLMIILFFLAIPSSRRWLLAKR